MSDSAETRAARAIGYALNDSGTVGDVVREFREAEAEATRVEQQRLIRVQCWRCAAGQTSKFALRRIKLGWCHFADDGTPEGLLAGQCLADKIRDAIQSVRPGRTMLEGE